MALLEVKNLHTYFKTRKGIVKAVNDVSYSLEPGKTIGIVGESGSGKSVSAMSILQLLDGNGYIANGEIWFGFLALPLSVISQFGDLAASVIKRRFGVKDYGKIFPGHGGVLDRFDSIIPVSVAAAFLLFFVR